MSMSPEIAKKILEGMRFNIKSAIIPQLKNAPYPTGQAVSTYVLLKTLCGYTSPEFRQHILLSNEEMRQAFRETKDLLCDHGSGPQRETAKLCQSIEQQLAKKVPTEDPFSDFQGFMEQLIALIKALWGEIAMDESIKRELKGRVNECLRHQLDRELALFA